MNVTNKIEKLSPKYNIESRRMDDNTLKLYSEKYLFDSWLVRQEEDILELYHMNKKLKKCSYHLQKSTKSKNWIWILQRINSHNEYVISRKWNARENMVDRVLQNYKKGK